MPEPQPDNKKYVWVVWVYGGCRRPSVEKFVLVKPNPGGGVTVKQYSGQKVIRPMAGKKFFFDEDAFRGYYRRWVELELESMRRRAGDLEEELALPDAGASSNTTVVPDHDIRPKNLKV